MSPTYVYQDYIHNFIIGRNYLKAVAKSKVECWRLGNENSEDAVSWNVFVGLYAIGGLPSVFKKLTGYEVKGEPELYLWGNHISGNGRKWSKLLSVRERLENGLRIQTEPDIILRIPGSALVLIEAKFGAKNSTLAKQKRRFGSVAMWLKRYACKGKPDPLDREWIGKQPEAEILEQLCRNVVFAHWLASENEQAIVVNLVRRAAINEEHTYDANHFCKHLNGGGVEFKQCTWEDIHEMPIIQGREGAMLEKYFRSKTLKLAPAFKV